MDDTSQIIKTESAFKSSAAFLHVDLPVLHRRGPNSSQYTFTSRAHRIISDRILRYIRHFRRHRLLAFTIAKVLELLYLLISIPLRIGFLFDPYTYSKNNAHAIPSVYHEATNKHVEWTYSLVALCVLDILAECVAVISIVNTYQCRRRSLAALAADASVHGVASRHKIGRIVKKKTNSIFPSIRKSVGSEPAIEVADEEEWSVNATIADSSVNPVIASARYTDLFALVPLELMAILLGPNALHVLRINKLLRLIHVKIWLRSFNKRYSSHRFVQIFQYTGMKLLLRTIVAGFVMCHVTACGYMLIAHLECGIYSEYCSEAATSALMLGIPAASSAHRRLGGTQSGGSSTITGSIPTSWAIEDRLIGATLLRKYARALYWSSRTLITVGYYDVAPKTTVETLYAIFAQLIGAIFSTSLIATSLFIFRYRNLQLAKFNDHVDNAKTLMKLYHFTPDLKARVMAYYNYAWTVHGGLAHENEVLEQLPEHLRNKCYHVMRTERVRAVSYLSKEKIEFLTCLASKLSHRIYSPNDWIIKKVPDSMYFVCFGEVITWSRSCHYMEPRVICSGGHFAESALLYSEVSELRTEMRARSQVFSELHQLSQATFSAILSDIYGDQASTQLEKLRFALSRREQQQQKTKKMLGEFVENRQTQVSIVDDMMDDSSALELPKTATSLTRIWLTSVSYIHQLTSFGVSDWLRGCYAPSSSFRYYWEHVRLLCLAYIAYEVPYYIVFEAGTYPFENKATSYANIETLVSIFIEAFFLFDFIFRCQYFAIIDPVLQQLVRDPEYLKQQYRKNYSMITDLMALVPIALFAQLLPMIKPGHISLFRLLRLLRVRQFPAQLSSVIHLRDLSSRAGRAINLIFYVTLTLHLSGCLWFEMAALSIDSTFLAHTDQNAKIDKALNHHSQLTRNMCLRDATLYRNCSWIVHDCYGYLLTHFSTPNAPSMYTRQFAYLRSIYWAIVALTTVGYGDIVAFSTAESLFAAIWVFIGGIINYGVVAAMSNIIANSMSSNRHFIERIGHKSLALAHFGISKNISNQVRRYYQQQALLGQKIKSETILLKYLPDQLRQQISMMLHADAIRRIQLFSKFRSGRMLSELTVLFRRRMYQRGDLLVTEEKHVCEELFVVVSGKVDVYNPELKDAIAVRGLSDGDSFGVTEMLLRHSHVVKLIARSAIVEVSFLTYKAFHANIVLFYPTYVQNLNQVALQQYNDEQRAMQNISRNLTNSLTLSKCLKFSKSLYNENELELHQPGTRTWQHKQLFRLLWEGLIIGIHAYNAFTVSYRIAFLPHVTATTRSVLFGLDILQDALLWIDIFLKAFYFGCDRATIKNLWYRTEKNREYMSGTVFKVDVISVTPIYYALSTSTDPCTRTDLWASLTRVVRLLRLYSLQNLTDTFVFRLQQRFISAASHHSIASMGLIKLLLVLIFAAHVGGCVFFMLSKANRRAKYNPIFWIYNDHVLLQELDPHVLNASDCKIHVRDSLLLYTRSFYWALTTLTLVGSKEITPLDFRGTIWAAFTCICCTFVVGHIIGEISELVLEDDKSKKELIERVRDFEHFAKDNCLSQSIRSRSVHYLKFHHSYTNGMELSIQEAFTDLSPTLKAQLYMNYYEKTLRALPLTRFLDRIQLHAFAMGLHSELYIPGDAIVREGDSGHCLYVIKRGLCMVVWERTASVVATLGSGSVFGEVAFFLPGQQRTATVQAMNCSELYVLNRTTLRKIFPATENHDSSVDRATMSEYMELTDTNANRIIVSSESKNFGRAGLCRKQISILSWVRACIKVYNLVTMEVLKELHEQKQPYSSTNKLKTAYRKFIHARQFQSSTFRIRRPSRLFFPRANNSRTFGRIHGHDGDDHISHNPVSPPLERELKNEVLSPSSAPEGPDISLLTPVLPFQTRQPPASSGYLGVLHSWRTFRARKTTSAVAPFDRKSLSASSPALQYPRNITRKESLPTRAAILSATESSRLTNQMEYQSRYEVILSSLSIRIAREETSALLQKDRPEIVKCNLEKLKGRYRPRKRGSSTRRLRESLSLRAPLSNLSNAVVQLNPAAPSLRPFLTIQDVKRLENECWRRYRMTLILSESFRSEIKPAGENSRRNHCTEDMNFDKNLNDELVFNGRCDSQVAERTDTRKNQKHPFNTERLTPNARHGPSNTFVVPFETDDNILSADDALHTIKRTLEKPESGDQTGKFRAKDDFHLKFLSIREYSTDKKQAKFVRVHRTRSLPHFDEKFRLKWKLEAGIDVKNLRGKCKYDYEMLRHANEPKFTILFGLYIRYREWLSRGQAEVKDEQKAQFFFLQWTRRCWTYIFQSNLFVVLGWRKAMSHHGQDPSHHPDGPSYESGHAVGHLSNLARLFHGPASSTYTSNFSERTTTRHTEVPRRSSFAIRKKPMISKMNKRAMARDYWHFLIRAFRIWQIFMLITATWYAIAIPVLIAFAPELQSEISASSSAFWQYYPIFLIFEILAFSNIALRHTLFHGVVHLNLDTERDNVEEQASDQLRNGRITDHVKTFARLRWSILEAISALPSSLVLILLLNGNVEKAEHQKWTLLACLQLNKLLTVFPFLKEYSEGIIELLLYELQLPLSDCWIRFFRSLSAYILAGHWIACIWYLTGTYAYHTYHVSWISMNDMLAVTTFYSLHSISYIRRYIRSLHFAVGSITTVFYGDIASLNILETVVEIGVILASIFILGILVGAHSERIEAQYKKKMLFEQSLSQVRDFAKRYNLPSETQHCIKQFYTHAWLQFRGQDDSEHIHPLSVLLAQDIAQFRLHGLAKRVQIFRSCDDSFLRRLLTCLKHIICSDEETIVQKGEIDRSLYFIARGKIVVSGPGFQLVKQQGDYFGELSLLYGAPRSATCSSMGMTLLYVLQWREYEALLEDFPEHRYYNRREWVLVSVASGKGEAQFRSVMDIVAQIHNVNWNLLHKIIGKQSAS